MKYDFYSFIFHKLLTAVLRLVAPQFRCTVEYCATNFWRPLTVGLTIDSKHLYLEAAIDYDMIQLQLLSVYRLQSSYCIILLIISTEYTCSN